MPKPVSPEVQAPRTRRRIQEVSRIYLNEAYAIVHAIAASHQAEVNVLATRTAGLWEERDIAKKPVDKAAEIVKEAIFTLNSYATDSPMDFQAKRRLDAVFKGHEKAKESLPDFIAELKQGKLPAAGKAKGENK